jgi:hypothetical protein
MHNAKSRHQPYVSSTAASWACQLCCEIKRGRGPLAVVVAVWPLLRVDVQVEVLRGARILPAIAANTSRELISNSGKLAVCQVNSPTPPACAYGQTINPCHGASQQMC